MAAKERTRRVEATLQRVRLKDVKGVQCESFPRACCKEWVLRRAILHDPKLIFFDEPMSGLDPMGRREVRDLMEELKHEGKTVICFSTHILSDAEALCDRVGIIHKGELRGVGAIADLTSSVQGKVEVIWRCTPGDAQIPASMKALGAGVPRDRRYGARHSRRESAGTRPSTRCAREHLKLISITPGAHLARSLFRGEIAARRNFGGEIRMNSRIFHIASNTFREAVRDRVLYNLIAFALLLSGAAILVGQISIEIEKLVVINLGLTAVSLFGDCDRDLHRDRPGFERNREADALYDSFPSGAALGIHRGQILWTGGNVGGEHVFHGDWSLCRFVLCCAQIRSRRLADPGRTVFHRAGVSDHLLTFTFIFVVLFPASFRRLRLFAFCYWQLCRGSARLRRDGSRIYALAGHRSKPTWCRIFPPSTLSARSPTNSRWLRNWLCITPYMRFSTLPWHSAERVLIFENRNLK